MLQNHGSVYLKSYQRTVITYENGGDFEVDYYISTTRRAYSLFKSSLFTFS